MFQLVLGFALVVAGLWLAIWYLLRRRLDPNRPALPAATEAHAALSDLVHDH